MYLMEKLSFYNENKPKPLNYYGYSKLQADKVFLKLSHQE